VIVTVGMGLDHCSVEDEHGGRMEGLETYSLFISLHF
jgi:hypothetical protein